MKSKAQVMIIDTQSILTALFDKLIRKSRFRISLQIIRCLIVVIVTLEIFFYIRNLSFCYFYISDSSDGYFYDRRLLAKTKMMMMWVDRNC